VTRFWRVIVTPRNNIRTANFLALSILAMLRPNRLDSGKKIGENNQFNKVFNNLTSSMIVDTDILLYGVATTNKP
jgi:hypothetical protein